jgi:hypothetical protein
METKDLIGIAVLIVSAFSLYLNLKNNKEIERIKLEYGFKQQVNLHISKTKIENIIALVGQLGELRYYSEQIYLHSFSERLQKELILENYFPAREKSVRLFYSVSIFLTAETTELFHALVTKHDAIAIAIKVSVGSEFIYNRERAEEELPVLKVAHDEMNKLLRLIIYKEEHLQM